MMHSSSPVLPTRHHIRNSWPSSFISANDAWSESNEMVCTTSPASASMLVALKLSVWLAIPGSLRASVDLDQGAEGLLGRTPTVLSPTGERRRTRAADALADPVHHRQRGGRALQLLRDAEHPRGVPGL